MTISLDHAYVYDIETLPNVFTMAIEALNNNASYVWEISEYRDDRQSLLAWLGGMKQYQTPLIGFNNLHFDYPVVHFLYMNPHVSVAQIYDKAMAIITGGKDARFGHTIWESDRICPQIDLFKINHFDNPSKSTSLKALQVNMRSPTVVDSPVQFGTNLTREQIDRDLIPYNRHDVQETKRFAQYCMPALNFRLGLIDEFNTLEVLNYNDTKIGVKLLEKRLGEDVCYEWRDEYDRNGQPIIGWNGQPKRRKYARQTQRDRIALDDIIFDYVRFDHPEFKRIIEYLRTQVLTPEDIDAAEDGVESSNMIRTKGVFKKLTANVGGIDFGFGTGGVHASVSKRSYVASGPWKIVDIDVKALYPRLMIVNKLAPEHLGERFISVFSTIPDERETYAKGTVQNASLKLAGNGAYGNTNAKHGFLRDPLVTMTTTINGQLLACMLAEWLVTVSSLQLIQANTDGITYLIHEQHEPIAAMLCRFWEEHTSLVLERAEYSRMWIADVNTYVAETLDGKLKQKGRLWHPDPNDYAGSISNGSPPAWHKDLGNVVSIRAAVQAMVTGVDPERWIRDHRDCYDFMCRAKAGRSDRLMLGDRQVQNTTRYYVAIEGDALVKISPPSGVEGTWKRASGVTQATYEHVMRETGGEWHEAVCTKNKSRYETRRTTIESGWKIAECNDVASFDWTNVNYDWYIAEARKLIVS